jgi:hypothetical protein
LICDSFLIVDCRSLIRRRIESISIEDQESEIKELNQRSNIKNQRLKDVQGEDGLRVPGMWGSVAEVAGPVCRLRRVELARRGTGC